MTDFRLILLDHTAYKQPEARRNSKNAIKTFVGQVLLELYFASKISRTVELLKVAPYVSEISKIPYSNFCCSLHQQVTKKDQQFQEIMKCYRRQPQAKSHVYRSVLLRSRKRHSSDESSDSSQNGSSQGSPPDAEKKGNKLPQMYTGDPRTYAIFIPAWDQIGGLWFFPIIKITSVHQGLTSKNKQGSDKKLI